MKNSSALACPPKCQTPRLKHRARATQTNVQVSDSLSETTCALRWKTPRSSASIASTKTLKPIQSQKVVGMGGKRARADQLREPATRPGGRERVGRRCRRKRRAGPCIAPVRSGAGPSATAAGAVWSTAAARRAGPRTRSCTAARSAGPASGWCSTRRGNSSTRPRGRRRSRHFPTRRSGRSDGRSLVYWVTTFIGEAAPGGGWLARCRGHHTLGRLGRKIHKIDITLRKNERVRAPPGASPSTPIGPPNPRRHCRRGPLGGASDVPHAQAVLPGRQSSLVYRLSVAAPRRASP